MTSQCRAGLLVTGRDLEWVVRPSDHPDTLLLRPPAARDEQTTGIYLVLRLKEIRSAAFSFPDPRRAGDLASDMLL